MKVFTIGRKMLALFNKYFVIIIIVIVLIVLGIGYMAFIKDKVSQIQKVGNVDYQLKEDERDRKEVIIEKLERLEEEYNKISTGQIKELDNVIPTQVDIPELIIKLKQFVVDNNLILTSIDIGGAAAAEATKESSSATIKQLNISLVISGIDSYNRFKSFLDSLEKNMPLLKMNSLTYSPKTDSYSFTLITYYLGN